jgi:hypothetical protein
LPSAHVLGASWRFNIAAGPSGTDDANFGGGGSGAFGGGGGSRGNLLALSIDTQALLLLCAVLESSVTAFVDANCRLFNFSACPCGTDGAKTSNRFCWGRLGSRGDAERKLQARASARDGDDSGVNVAGLDG